MTVEGGSSGEPSADALIDRLAAEALELLERGESAAVETLLAQHPGAASAVRERLKRLAEIGMLVGPQPEPVIPPRLGPFRLGKKLGGGGMGVVFLAQQEPLGREVALKIIRPDQAYFEGARERFGREVEAIARLKHPGIVAVYTFGEEQGVPFYAMERVDGCNLFAVLKALQGRRPEELSGRDLARAVAAETGAAPPSEDAEPSPVFQGSWIVVCFRLIEQVADALQHAHERGVLHRDIKPSNIMITPAGRVLLLDFGLASTHGPGHVTRSGTQLGSLAYMAPEQVRGDVKAVSERTDIYQVGVTLYELLTLRSPFLHGSHEVTQRLILEGAPPPISSLNPAVPWDAETVCATAMERDAARRYATTAELARDLRNFLEHRPIAARRPGSALRLRRFVERHPARSTGLLLGLLLLVSGVVYSLSLRAVNRDLESTNASLITANQTKDAALTRAEREAERANTNFRRALEAVNKMLIRTGFDRLMSVPEFDPVRRKLLQDAERLYRELLAERSDDAKTRFEMARSQRIQGQILHSLGKLDQARALILASASALEQLVQEMPLDAYVREQLASSASAIGLIRLDQGRLEEAIESFEEAVTLSDDARRLIENEGNREEEVRLRFEQAGSLQNLGQALLKSGLRPDAEEKFEEACGILEEIVAQESTRGRVRVEYRMRLAVSLSNLSAVKHESGRSEESLELARRAVTQATSLAVAGPTDSSVQEILGIAWMNVGAAATDDAVGAEGWRKAMEIYRDLALRFPDRTENWAILHSAVAALATNRTRNGAPLEAEPLLRQVLATDRTRPDDPPDLLVARINTLAVLGRVLEETERLAEAEKLLRSAGERSAEFRRAWPEFPDWRNILSRPDARLASVLRRQGRLDEAFATAQKSFDLARATAATPATSITSLEELSRQAILLVEISCQREDPEAFAAIAGDRARLREWLSGRPGSEAVLEAWGAGPKR